MGCAKNSVDSEHLIGMLEFAGHEMVNDAEEAQVGIINTCAFIQDAVKENVDAILDIELWKERGALRKIVVAGCIVNRYEAELRKELPSVDLWVRAEEWDKIIAFLDEKSLSAHDVSNCLPAKAPRGLLSENRPWSRYLKVGEGCDTFCSYCTIPLIRGRLRSVPVERLVDEALGLAGSGAREICLVGQDLTVYGKDLYPQAEKPAIEKLLSALDEALPDETWIRLLYLHPDRITHEFVDFLRGSKKILPYMDIPVQHIDDAILAAMNRSPASRHIQDIIAYVRGKDPFFALRTTLMTGFPGETEESFIRVLDFLEEAEIDRVGAFMYSQEEGTKAALLPGQIPEELKEERYRRLLELQSHISQERNALFLGRTLRVLVEEIDLEGDLAWGRSYRDAPEVDGMVCVESGGTLAPGSWVDVEIVDSAEHDLFGAPVSRKEAM